jgi:isoleucyl-tRNA synthetase
VDGWDSRTHFEFGKNITDNWVISKLQTLKMNIAREMEGYKLYNVVPQLFDFIEDLTNWYIRLNRSRFWGEGLTSDKKQAYSTLYTCVLELSQAMAPFAPFLSEYVYRELLKFDSKVSERPESVHLCSYPVADESKINPGLERAVERMQQVILLGRQKRVQVGVKVKTPLRQLTVIHKDADLLEGIKQLESYLKIELNVKNVAYEQDEAKFINLYAKPNLPVLGKRLGKEMGKYVGLIQKLGANDLAQVEEKGTVKVGDQDFGANELLIFREAKPGTNALSNRLISIDLDCVLDRELELEGLAREVVNRIQRTRKEIGLNVDDRINCGFEASGDLLEAITRFGDYIKSETLAQELKTASGGQEFDVDGQPLKLTLKKV